MNEKRRNELFEKALINALNELDKDTTHEKRTQMINVIEFIHSTQNEEKAFKALNNQIVFI